MGSKSNSQNQSQSTSQQTLDPQIKGALLGNYGQANATFNPNTGTTPYAYSGQLVAPFNPTQTAGNNALLGVANSGVGNAALGQAVGAAGGVAGYNPQQVNAGQLSSTDLSPYFNPYNQDVTNRTLSDLDRFRQMANVGNDASATQAGAFGGDRSAVLDSLTNGEFARTAATSLAGLNQANYQNAQSAAQGDITNRLGASEANQNAGLQGAGLNLQGASTLGNLSGQQLGQSTSLANLIRQVGGQQQSQQQAVDTAGQQNFQQSLGNKISLQQLLNQALGLAGNPTLTKGQSTASGSSSSTSLSPQDLALFGTM